MIKLCYKEYDYKMSLKAIKGFKKDTGEDLMFTLSKVLESWSDSDGLGYRARINSIYSSCDFELGCYAFYHLINGVNKDVPMVEIEDAMFRVGIMPNGADDKFSFPWPLVLVDLATEIEQDLMETSLEKKQDIAK